MNNLRSNSVEKFSTLLALGILLSSSGALAQSTTLPAFGHVVVVPLENHGYSQTVGSCSNVSGSPMPYLQSLLCSNGLATNYVADTHPSIGNYFVLTTGQILSNNDSDTPSSLPVSADNIALEAQTAGKSWKDYVECLSTVGSSATSGTCSNGDNFYIRHDPLAYMTNINQANRVDFSQFASDLTTGVLPNFSFIAPDGCHDAHDCSLSTADSWLQANIDPLIHGTSLGAVQFQTDGLLVIVFDEDGNTGSTSCSTSQIESGTWCGGQVEAVVVSPFIVAAGYQSSNSYHHENVLRLMAQGLGLTFTNLGAAANPATSNANMSDFFSTSATGSITLSPTSATLTAAVGSSATQTFTISNSTLLAVSVTSVALVPGTLGAEFTQTNNCSTLSASGGSCTVTVTFSPTSTGSATATLSVVDSASTTALTAALTGATESASVSPASLTFSSPVGVTSAAQNSTLTNTGTTTLTGVSISISGSPFALASGGTCGTSLAAGASCTLSVNFTPTTTGTFTGTVTVTDSAGTQTVSLTGTGTSSTGGGSTTDFYVSTTGSDSSGTGSATSPWATIAHASTLVTAGATVHVAAGVYNGSFSTNSSGTSSAYLSYVADSADFSQPVNCAQVTANHGSLSSCVQLVGTSGSTWSNYGDYVAIQGFDVSGPNIGLGPLGIWTGGNATKIIGNSVHDIETSSCGTNGNAAIGPDGANGVVDGNYVYNIGQAGCAYSQGIYPNSGSSGTTVIENNIVFKVAEWGIQSWGNSGGDIIVNNTIFNTGGGCIVIGTDTTGQTNGNDFVANNICYATPGGIEEQGYSALATGTNNVYENNLFYDVTTTYSLLNGLLGIATVNANPQFVNYTGDATGDYHLQSTSPAIATATSTNAPASDFDGNTRPQNGAWDIGAYEYVGAASSSAVSVSPTALTFASQTVGTTSSAQTVTLSNGTSSAVSLTSIAISGTNSADFAEGNNCGTSVAAGGSCTINVTFTPNATGTLTATLTVAPGSGSALTASLTGTGVSATAAAASLSPLSLSFGNQLVGTTSAAQSATLSNTGNASLSITGITTTGPFGQTNNCGSSVAAGATCTISITFTPTALGTQTGTLAVSDNAAGSPQTLSLTGAGAGPAATLSPTSLSFAKQIVGTRSAAQTITLTNSGGAPLAISSITVSSGFSESNTCGSSVAAGGQCAIQVTFAPTAGGAVTGTLTVADNASNSPQTVSLSGTGEDFSLKASTTNMAVSPGSSTTLKFEALPLGGFNQTVSFDCSNVPAGATCSVTPVAVTLNGSTGVVLELTVNTTAPSSVVPNRWDRRIPAPPLSPGLLAIWIAVLAVFGFVRAWRCSRRAAVPWKSLVPLTAILLALELWTACGVAPQRPPTSNTLGLAAGTYSLKAKGTSGNLNHSITVQLEVQ